MKNKELNGLSKCYNMTFIKKFEHNNKYTWMIRKWSPITEHIDRIKWDLDDLKSDSINKIKDRINWIIAYEITKNCVM